MKENDSSWDRRRNSERKRTITLNFVASNHTDLRKNPRKFFFYFEMLIKSVGKESLFDDQNPPGKACTRLVNGDPCEMLVVRAICRVLRVFRYTEVMYGAEDDLYCEICTRTFDKTGQRIRGTFFYTQASFKCPAANCEAQLTFRQFITGNCCRKAADEIESGKDLKFKFFF